MERSQKVYHKEPIDFYAVISQVWESQELHLHQNGFHTAWKAESPPYPVLGDADALAQILINLLSNAEKYSAEIKEVELHSYQIDDQVRVSVLDRGLGIPAGEEVKIFEHFYRAHDSLSSGIQGTGLGLTLAQKMAKGHGGTIFYEARKEGGSRFTLQLPLIKIDSNNTLIR
jgi:signal transduction histidine kinase